MNDGTYKITGATIARTVVLIFAIINQLLATAGKPIIPIEDETISELVNHIFLIVAAIITFWKNNSFTQAALKGDAVMREERLIEKENKKSDKEAQ